MFNSVSAFHSFCPYPFSTSSISTWWPPVVVFKRSHLNASLRGNKVTYGSFDLRTESLSQETHNWTTKVDKGPISELIYSYNSLENDLKIKGRKKIMWEDKGMQSFDGISIQIEMCTNAPFFTLSLSSSLCLFSYENTAVRLVPFFSTLFRLLNSLLSIFDLFRVCFNRIGALFFGQLTHKFTFHISFS